MNEKSIQKSWGARHPLAIGIGVAAIVFILSQWDEYFSGLGETAQGIGGFAIYFVAIPTLVVLCISSKIPPIRRILLGLYGIAFIPSLVLAALSPMAFDSGASASAYITILTLLALPITIIIAMLKSKHSLWWFLLPLSPLFIALFVSALSWA